MEIEIKQENLELLINSQPDDYTQNEAAHCLPSQLVTVECRGLAADSENITEECHQVEDVKPASVDCTYWQNDVNPNVSPLELTGWQEPTEHRHSSYTVMAGIDSEIVISLVEAKPVLWDKTLDVFKDRTATRNAWDEVCLSLRPDFDAISDIEKNAFAKEVIKRWTNLRDCFAKSKRDEKARRKGRSSAKIRKKYVFADQMQFLNKIYSDSNMVDSMDPESEPGLGTLEDDGQAGSSSGAPDETCVSANGNMPTRLVESVKHQKPEQFELKLPKTAAPGPRKHKKIDQVELKMLAALEPKTPCSKMAFLQSLMPYLQKFSNKEFLQFQMGTLGLIDNINKRQEANMLYSPPNYSSPVAQFMPQLPTNQAQIFAQQPPFPHQQCAYPAFGGLNSKKVDQHSSSGQPNHSNSSKHQRLKKSKQSKPETTPASQQEYCLSDSSQSENVASSPVSPSADSNASDMFN